MSISWSELVQDMAGLHLTAVLADWDSETYEDDKLGRRYQTFTHEGSEHMIEHWYEMQGTRESVHLDEFGGFEWSGYRLTTWAWGCPDADGLPCCFTYRIGARTRLEDMLVPVITAELLNTLHIKRKAES